MKCKLLEAIRNKDIDGVKSILHEANQQQLLLDINNGDCSGYPLIEAIESNTFELVQLIINYAKEKNIILEVNGTDEEDDSPLLKASMYNAIETMKLIIDYANANHIVLEINEQNGDGMYPMLLAFTYNNMEMARVLMDYADANAITLNLNLRNSNRCCPLLLAVLNGNVEMVQMVVDYAIKNNMILTFFEKDLEDILNENEDDTTVMKTMSEINPEIIKLFLRYINDYRIEITFTPKSTLSKMIFGSTYSNANGVSNPSPLGLNTSTITEQTSVSSPNEMHGTTLSPKHQTASPQMGFNQLPYIPDNSETSPYKPYPVRSIMPQSMPQPMPQPIQSTFQNGKQYSLPMAPYPHPNSYSYSNVGPPPNLYPNPNDVPSYPNGYPAPMNSSYSYTNAGPYQPNRDYYYDKSRNQNFPQSPNHNTIEPTLSQNTNNNNLMKQN